MKAQIMQVAEEVGHLARQLGIIVTTVESCTGGQVAGAITDIAGSSRWFEAGFVTYSNEAKQQMVGVSANSLRLYGAVSRQVVEEMVAGGCRVSGARLGVAISGVAGPDGGSDDKPVGTVWIAWGNDSDVFAHRFKFDGTRAQVRESSVLAALSGLRSWLAMWLQEEPDIATAMKEKYDASLQQGDVSL